MKRSCLLCKNKPIRLAMFCDACCKNASYKEKIKALSLMDRKRRTGHVNNKIDKMEVLK